MNKKYSLLIALKVSNTFATIDYDAHINTKIDYTINDVILLDVIIILETLLN